jgi:hypothetical protein
MNEQTCFKWQVGNLQEINVCAAFYVCADICDDVLDQEFLY